MLGKREQHWIEVCGDVINLKTWSSPTLTLKNYFIRILHEVLNLLLENEWPVFKMQNEVEIFIIMLLRTIIILCLYLIEIGTFKEALLQRCQVVSSLASKIQISLSLQNSPQPKNANYTLVISTKWVQTKSNQESNHQRIYLLISERQEERERKRKREREREIERNNVREKHPPAASCVHPNWGIKPKI